MPEPTLIRRRCGGWLAVSPRDESLQFGVTASTEEEARSNYAQALLRWREILAMPWEPKEPWPPGTFDNMRVRQSYGPRRYGCRRLHARARDA